MRSDQEATPNRAQTRPRPNVLPCRLRRGRCRSEARRRGSAPTTSFKTRLPRRVSRPPPPFGVLPPSSTEGDVVTQPRVPAQFVGQHPGDPSPTGRDSVNVLPCEAGEVPKRSEAEGAAETPERPPPASGGGAEAKRGGGGLRRRLLSRTGPGSHAESAAPLPPTGYSPRSAGEDARPRDQARTEGQPPPFDGGRRRYSASVAAQFVGQHPGDHGAGADLLGLRGAGRHR